MPFGKYKNMEDCIQANQDKESPGGYCAALHKKITGKYPSESYSGETNMDEMKEITEPSKKYSTVKITSKVEDTGTEIKISKIADAYKALYDRANQTLDVSRIDSEQVQGIIDELKKSNITAKAVASEMLKQLNERMNKVLGKQTAAQAVTQSEPLPPKTIKEEAPVEEPLENNDLLAKYDPYEFLIGATVELEHTDNVIAAMKIAMDHLNEMPDYYSQLLTFVEPDFNPTDKLKEEPVDMKEYQTPGGSNINVGRMIKNMSRIHIKKFNSKRNLKDRFKTMFKMRSPKDDMNAAMQNRESYTIVGEFDEPADAAKILNSLLIKKRNAQLMTNKEGKSVIIVEEQFEEDNTMDNSQDLTGTKIIKKKKESKGDEDGSN